LTLQAVIDSAARPYLDQEREAARRDTTLDGSDQAVFERATLRLRDSTVARAGLRYDEALLERVLQAFRALPVASAESSMAARLRDMSVMPVVSPADTGGVLAATPSDTIRVADLLRQWRNLSPYFRPRIETTDQVKMLVGNALLERQLRREAERRRLAERPDIRARLDERHEYFAVSQFVDREVWNKIPRDSVTLRRYFDRNRSEWIVPAHVSTLRLQSASQAEADSFVSLLRNRVRADSLVAQAKRANLDVFWRLAASEDSVLHARLAAAGRGAVVGPFLHDNLLTVVRVLEVLPPRDRDFDEVRKLVEKAWTDREGERRMRELLAGLRKETRIWIRPEYR
jgi:hypothetical protein